MTMMPAKTGVSDTYPLPSNATARAAFAQLWDAINEGSQKSELDLASAATCDIGGQASMKLRITGTTTISSFGTNYRGPILLRMAGALTIAHNAASLICPGAANLLTVAGDMLLMSPKSTSGTMDGWTVSVLSKSALPPTTVLAFFQAAAPTGWTQITTHNNKALRVVSGTGGGSGGSVAFTTAFASKSVTGTVGGHALTINEMPSHNHAISVGSGSGAARPDMDPNDGNAWSNTAYTETTGGGQTHNHSFTGTAINLAVQYIDMILASKD